jgi:REP element-mobilizing transposase RayT
MTDFRFQPRGLKSDFGWHNRGYIPHFDGGEVSQFITIRLFDSMPQELLDKWRSEVSTEVEFRKNVEKYLDSGYGECWLRDTRVAELVQNSLCHYDGAKYRLIVWVVMPNHAHFLITPLADVHLSEVLHSLKSYTAHEANKLLGRSGQFWQHESFDRYIRNIDHYSNVIKYIEMNPVKAGLCVKKEDWKFSSANRRRSDP